MDVFQFIRLRMINMGFDPDQVVIEPEVVIFDGTTEMIEASNVYYFLYEVMEYTHAFDIDSNNESLNNIMFVVDATYPSGIYVFTGDIIITSMTSAANKLLFYKVTTGGLLNEQPPIPPQTDMLN